MTFIVFPLNKQMAQISAYSEAGDLLGRFAACIDPSCECTGHGQHMGTVTPWSEYVAGIRAQA